MAICGKKVRVCVGLVFLLTVGILLLWAVAEASQTIPRGQRVTKYTPDFLAGEKLLAELPELTPEQAQSSLANVTSMLGLTRLEAATRVKNNPMVRTRGVTFVPEEGIEADLAAKAVAAPADSSLMCLIQMYDDPNIFDVLDIYRTGARLYRSSFVENAIVGQVPAGAIDGLAGLPSVRWVGELRPRHKYSDEDLSKVTESEEEDFFVFVLGEKKDSYTDELQQLGIVVHRYDEASRSYRVKMNKELFETLISFPWVERIDPYVRPILHQINPNNALNYQVDDSRECVSAVQVWNENNHADATRVGIIDTGIDAGHPDFPAGSIGHTDAEDVRFYPDGRRREPGHGTHVSGIVASRGLTDLRGEYDAKGVGYGAQLWVYDFWDDFADNLHELDDNNVHIASNSWGAIVYDDYTATARTADSYVDNEGMTIIFAAGNQGVCGDQTVSSPATAKNVVSVGAISYTIGGVSNGIGRRAFYSSQGPTGQDGRLKPEIVAPGGDATSYTPDYLNWPSCIQPGSADYDFGVVSTRASYNPVQDPDHDWDWAEDQQRYRTMWGTSQAAPHIAGIAGLFYGQYWGEVFPGGDGLCPRDFTANLIANAIPILDYGEDGDADFGYPNTETGYGLADALHTIYDVPNENVAVLWGHGGLVWFFVESQDWDVTIPGTPLRVIFVLCYEDQEGSASDDEALWDDLDMEVREGGEGGTLLETWKQWVNNSSIVDTEGPVEKVVDNSPSNSYRITVRSNFHDIFGSQRYTVLVMAQYVDPELEMYLSTTDFGVPVGATVKIPFIVTNTGGRTAAGVVAELAGAGLGDFSGHKSLFVGNIVGTNTSVFDKQFVLTAPDTPGVYHFSIQARGINRGLGVSNAVDFNIRVVSAERCMDFEDGADAAPIRSTIPGMTFTTTQGFDWIYGDKTTGNYNVHPYGSGAYVCNGNVFAWLGPNQGMGRIDFTGETAKSISMWTSCAYTMWLEAYDRDDNLLASDHVPGNLWTHTLSQLSVTASNIKYVLVHDRGNYWLIDDLCVDDLLGEAEAFLPEGAEPAMQVLDVISQGAIMTHVFSNPGLGILHVVLHWFGSEMSLTIYAPDGSLHGEWQTDSPPILVTIPYAQPGEWQFDITAVDVPEDDYPYALVVGAAAAPPDTTPPVVVIHSPIDGKSYFNTSPVNFSFSAEDQQSGISEISALLDGLVPVENDQDTLLTDLRSHSLQVIAVNGVGLADTVWATFSINGFRWLKPITYLDSLQTETIRVRRNSTLPIKFTVFDSSGAFVADTTVRVIIEGTQVDFRYGQCDTCVRIDDEDPEEPKYIANLHTNFKHWDYGIYIGTEYWIKTFLNEVLAHKARVIVVEPPGHTSRAANVPEAFSLSQNSPNPFNPTCEIAYALPTDCQVMLSIYNILGQKVRVLVDEHQETGHKSVTWDGRDEQGQELTSGVYFYRIQAGDFAQSKKMVLVK